MERLQPEQVDGWVPRCVNEAIKSENSLGVQTFDRHAFIDSPCNLSECDPSLREEPQYTLGKVKQIFQHARTRLDRKAGFTLSYLHETSDLAALYALLLPRNSAVSHVSVAFTKTTALFSSIEVKPADGDKSEAEYQLSIFMGASLRKKAELARMAGMSDTASALIEPAFVVAGHEWY
ncbi:hypothetical protein CC80DRAFT_541753 [Byssothecium circinans]|uniref:PD-(D/E)XK nuclease-like domain-containing protein n=1 Tax=Byssothecium circinans TaxID=147558 RepID=A0A6A5UGS4_9PLEO|nr:hypothetical protein CC80DRAFT_541753 [Byssothecium circinans]